MVHIFPHIPFTNFIFSIILSINKKFATKYNLFLDNCNYLILFLSSLRGLITYYNYTLL